MHAARLQLARTLAAKTFPDSQELVECKVLLGELLRRLDAAEKVVEAAREYAHVEPPCHCGELAPGPCCPACAAEHAIRTALRAYDAPHSPPHP